MVDLYLTSGILLHLLYLTTLFTTETDLMVVKHLSMGCTNTQNMFQSEHLIYLIQCSDWLVFFLVQVF